MPFNGIAARACLKVTHLFMILKTCTFFHHGDKVVLFSKLSLNRLTFFLYFKSKHHSHSIVAGGFDDMS